MKLPLLLVTVLALEMARNPARSVESAPPSLEEIAAILEQGNKELSAELDKVVKLVETEAAAERLSEPAAQTLRWLLQTATSASGRLQIRSLISSPRLPTENATIMKALTDLDAVNTAVLARRGRIEAGVAQEIPKRVEELLRTGTKPAEGEALQRVISETRTALESNGVTNPQSVLANALDVVQRFTRLLAAEVKGDPEAVATAAGRLNEIANVWSSPGANYSVAIRDRTNRIAKPLAEARDAAQKALDEAITARKPAPELADALQRFADAHSRYAAVTAERGRTSEPDLGTLKANYAVLIDVLNTAAAGDVRGARAAIQRAQNLSQMGDGQRTIKFRQLIANLESELTKQQDAETAARWTALATRITGAKTPAELDAIASDLAGWSREMARAQGSDGTENWSQLAVELSALATTWAAPSAIGYGEDRYRENPGRNPAVSGAIRELRRRIERELLSTRLKLPELNSEPLSSMDTDAALDSVSDSLAAKEDWRRLHQLLEYRVGLQSARGRTLASDDALAALRSFFAAQNLELAEQWSDAASAYKAVLRASSPRAPTAAAAEKLKALIKAHPEAKSAPAAMSPGGLPFDR